LVICTREEQTKTVKNAKVQASGDKKERVQVWPDLVLRETIAALIAVILLVSLSMLVDAPLEEIADPSFSMNPSKAPWYFLGLQELLVYFTPWIAGVAIPVFIIIGLMAIPYIDVGRQEKKDAVVFTYEKQIRRLFSAGLCIWIVLTAVGLYFRGPNWAWQWPNGTIMESGSNNISLNWLLPVVVFLYFVGVLFNRYHHKRGNTGAEGFIRHFFSHLLTIMGLTVTIKIAVYNILDFMLK
jgi:hypothetical protein